MLILSFEDNEEHIFKRILSCLDEETEIMKHEIADEEKLIFEGLYIDKHRRIVVRKDNEIELTYTEFEILLLLAQNIGRVFSKEQIYKCCMKVHNSEVIIRYLYVIMRIYFICIINISNERRIICKENNLIVLDIDHYSV